MQISNPVITSRSIGQNPGLPAAGSNPNQTREEQNRRADLPVRPSSNGSTDIDSDAIAARGEELQNARVQRLNDIESAPLRTQQALNAYQQTETAASEYQFGELIGVDLFV